jgi:hypothetical protein
MLQKFYKIILPILLISLTGFGQKEFKFNASSLVNGMVDGGFEYIKKDVGYEGSIRGSNQPVKREVGTQSFMFASKKAGFGVRLNFYKKLEKSISGRYASVFTGYESSTIKTQIPEIKNTFCVGVACGKKWLMYNRIGVQGDFGLGYKIQQKQTNIPVNWFSANLKNNVTDFTFINNVYLPIRVAVIVRM